MKSEKRKNVTNTWKGVKSLPFLTYHIPTAYIQKSECYSWPDVKETRKNKEKGHASLLSELKKKSKLKKITVLIGVVFTFIIPILETLRQEIKSSGSA